MNFQVVFPCPRNRHCKTGMALHHLHGPSIFLIFFSAVFNVLLFSFRVQVRCQNSGSYTWQQGGCEEEQKVSCLLLFQGAFLDVSLDNFHLRVIDQTLITQAQQGWLRNIIFWLGTSVSCMKSWLCHQERIELGKATGSSGHECKFQKQTRMKHL